MVKFNLKLLEQEISDFLNTGFKTWCEQRSMAPFDIEHIDVYSNTSPIKKDLKNIKAYFSKLVEQLDGLVALQSKKKGFALFLSKLASIKEKYEHKFSSKWMVMVLTEINENTLINYGGMEQLFVDEDSGQLRNFMKFSEPAPYIYTWNIKMYKAYFDAATKDIWVSLHGYSNDFKEGRLTKTASQGNSEQEVGSIKDMREKLVLPLTLKEFDEKTKGRLGECFRVLSAGKGVVDSADRMAFINIFSYDAVKDKVIWKANLYELAYFIENIVDELKSRKYLSDRIASCFGRPEGEPKIEPGSFIHVIKKNKKDNRKVYEKKIEEYRKTKSGNVEKLDKAIKKFKGME